MGDDIGTEIIRQHGNEHTGEHIGTQQTLEGYTSRQHRYNLRIACQFRRKEYYGDEDKQRAEQIREIRNEVDIIVKDNGFERSMETAEFLQVLVDVKDDCQRDYQRDGKYISTNKLTDNIPVKSLQIIGWTEKTQPLQLPVHFMQHIAHASCVVVQPFDKYMHPHWMGAYPSGYLIARKVTS